MMLPDFSKDVANKTTPGTTGGIKNTVQQEKIVPEQPSTIKKVDIRYILAVILFTLAIISTGAMFGLNAYLDREIETVEGGISVLEETIKINDILSLATFDKQTQVLKNLTISRGGYSLLLTEVSKLVAPGVHYSSVSISSRDNEGYVITVKGIAESLTQYHQQIQRIEGAEGLLANGSFDGYTLQHDEGGSTTVLFTVSFVVPTAEVAEILNTIS